MKDYYTCPMHPEVKDNELGKCPKCGMGLVAKSEMSDGHDHHDHGSMMSSPDTAKDFLHRFFIVSALLVPLLAFSKIGVKYLGLPDFALRPYVEFLIASIIFYFGLVFFKHAKHEIIAKQYGMMTLVSLGVGAGYLFSTISTFYPSLEVEFYLEISTLIWVLLFGHFLEAKSSTAAGDALQEVAKLLPKKAHLKTDSGTTIDTDIEALKEGDIVLVKPGEKVPADGVIVDGSGNFNESHLTGESKPVNKSIDAEVSAGSINIDGSVEIKLLRVGESSTIGQIQYLISSAKKTKPSTQKLADKASGWLTFSAITVSIVTLLFWFVIASRPLVFAATLAITVLVIACPHALGLAIPTVSTIATKLAVKNGIFIKDMAKIETVRNADYVVFDKTGTLTKGEFGVTEIDPLETDQAMLMTIASSIESKSSHVIGLAITKRAGADGIELKNTENIKNIAGMGIEGTIKGKKYFVGNVRLMTNKNVMTEKTKKVIKKYSTRGITPVLIADDKQVLGVIGLSDQIKEESLQAVNELHKLGIKVAMLTGDTKTAAMPVAKELRIDTVFAEVLPEDKYKHIKDLQDQGNVVLMAGDGVNDAPALTQADAGIAIGAGTDVAVESGDIVLTQSNPQHIVRLIILSKKVYKKMKENLFWALGYNIIAIPAAAGLFLPFGFRLTPAVGALLMSLSSVIVVINAMALRKVKLNV